MLMYMYVHDYMYLKVFSLSGCINRVWLFFWFIWRASSLCNVSSGLSWSLYITGYTTILRNVRNLDIVYQDTSVYFCIMSNIVYREIFTSLLFSQISQIVLKLNFVKISPCYTFYNCPCRSFSKKFFAKLLKSPSSEKFSNTKISRYTVVIIICQYYVSILCADHCMSNGNLVVYSSILLITDVRIYINWVSRAYPITYGLSLLASGRFLGKTREETMNSSNPLASVLIG